jgi:hypothetical protein
MSATEGFILVCLIIRGTHWLCNATVPASPISLMQSATFLKNRRKVQAWQTHTFSSLRALEDV